MPRSRVNAAFEPIYSTYTPHGKDEIFSSGIPSFAQSMRYELLYICIVPAPEHSFEMHLIFEREMRILYALVNSTL